MWGYYIDRLKAYKKTFFICVLALALGALAALGFKPFGLYPLTVVSLSALMALWRYSSPKKGFFVGLFFGIGLFSLGVYWPFVSIHRYGGGAWPFALLLTGSLIVYLALYFALTGYIAARTRQRWQWLWALCIVPAAGVFFELLRGFGPLGFPWLTLGDSLVESPVNSLAPIGGVHLLSLVVFFLAGVLYLLWAGQLKDRLCAVVIIALLPVVAWLLPAATVWTHRYGQPIDVALIQANIAQQYKWDSQWFKPTLKRYAKLTEQQDADLVIWPEVAIPTTVRHAQDYLNKIGKQAADKNQTVLAGILTENNQLYYNTVVALGSGRGEYEKRHLVPFGEYFPLPKFALSWLDKLGMPSTTLGRGAEQQKLIQANGIKLGVSICFEDAFGKEIAKSQPQAGLLVNVTNDAWFTGTSAAAQHFTMSRMRALEAGRPMLRAANTGISAFISADGRVIKQAPQDELAVIKARMQPRIGQTPYMRVGNQPLWAFSVLVLVLSLGRKDWLKREKLAQHR